MGDEELRQTTGSGGGGDWAGRGSWLGADGGAGAAPLADGTARGSPSFPSRSSWSPARSE